MSELKSKIIAAKDTLNQYLAEAARLDIELDVQVGFHPAISSHGEYYIPKEVHIRWHEKGNITTA